MFFQLRQQSFFFKFQSLIEHGVSNDYFQHTAPDDSDLGLISPFICGDVLPNPLQLGDCRLLSIAFASQQLRDNICRFFGCPSKKLSTADQFIGVIKILLVVIGHRTDVYRRSFASGMIT